jgi:hypothetical protein
VALQTVRTHQSLLEETITNNKIMRRQQMIKNLKKILTALVLMVLVGAQTLPVSAQTFGYSITDNNSDVTFYFQQLYKINVNTGETTFIGDLTYDRNNDEIYNSSLAAGVGERIQREYEGLASIGGVLYGVSGYRDSESAPAELCNTGADPVTAISSDLRLIQYRSVFPIPTTPSTSNASGGAAGPQVGETCIDFGTETAMGYNAVDGFLYVIASDDLITLPSIRSRLYKIDPTNGLTVASFDITNPGTTGDTNPYLDGFTILPAGTAYASELRFSADPNPADPDTRDFGGLYQIDLSNGNATLVKHLLPTDINVDTGLANQANGTLKILNERGIIYTTTAAPTTAVTSGTAMRTTGATTGAGGGAAGLRIAGCRGSVAGDEFQATTLTIGGCRDFEGFDIPLVVLP